MPDLPRNTLVLDHHRDLQLVPETVALKPEADQEFVALIDNRNLERECFVRSIELLHPRVAVLGFPSAQAYLNMIGGSKKMRAIAVLLNVGSRQLPHPEIDAELACLLQAPNPSPVVVLGPSDELEPMLATLEAGAAGYIPANIGIDEIIDAMWLTSSGGVFLKLESLAKLRQVSRAKPECAEVFKELTSRQAAVAESLRRGKANKVIAYELNMCESTVKVHIRSIMRKLRSRNRTEAAYKLNALLSND